MERTHCAIVGIALYPAVTATIKAGAWSRIRCEIAIPTSLIKPRRTKFRMHTYHARLRQLESREEKMRTQIRPEAQLSGTAN
jgi:hypothetical protein